MALHSDVKKYYVFRALLKRFILPILILYGLDRGLSLSELSIIAAVGSVISFVLEIPSGAIADRFGHRHPAQEGDHDRIFSRARGRDQELVHTRGDR